MARPIRGAACGPSACSRRSSPGTTVGPPAHACRGGAIGAGSCGAGSRPSALWSTPPTSLAAERLIPIGLFDLDRIQGAVELTLSTPGEAFMSIGQGEPVALPDGTPVLRDALGVFSAIGTRDSARTRIVADTTDLLVVSWGVSGGRRDADRRHAGRVRRARPSRPMSDALPSHPAPLMSGSFCSSFGVRSWLPDAAMIRRG